MGLSTAWIFIAVVVSANNNEDLFLPASHIRRTPSGRMNSQEAPNTCWGHEPDCAAEHFDYVETRCSVDEDRFSGRKSSDIFFEQGDMGFVRAMRNSMSVICEPDGPRDSALVCAQNLQFCSARNVRIDFTDVQDMGQRLKYSMDVLKAGQIVGKCSLNAERLRSHFDFMAPLQSWAPELRNFEPVLDYVDSTKAACDVFVEKPTVILKLDAEVNMYHHFCDFFNLYASLHMNLTFYPRSFDRDINLLIWDNSVYRSAFGDVFRAFTTNPLLNLNSYGRRKVCFRNLMLPFLPRMIFGLFYNTPLIAGCEHSGLFQAFHEFLVHRLGIKQTPGDNSKIRVTLISRQTQQRRIINEGELVAALEAVDGYEVRLAKFTHKTPFLEQVQLVHNTDVLVGMHGAGLTHLLFLPDWASVFEIYDCGDPGCYSDLARLRGVKYVAWTNQSLVHPHAVSDYDAGDENRATHQKFMNYAFDSSEFVRKVAAAAAHVRAHPLFAARCQSRTEHKRDEL